MQILFVHPNFPAQFGPALTRLGARADVACAFVSRTGSGAIDGVRRVRYDLRGGATRATHYCARTFENAVWSAHAVYEACKAASWLKPNVIVGHSGFGSTVFLQELYRCPIVSYFEYFYRAHDSDLDFRPDAPPKELDTLRSHTRNAMILLDLEACVAGYTPTRWQSGLLPDAYASKVRVIHDGVDTEFWRRRAGPRRLGDEVIGENTRVVTYVARGHEAMRGFDIFVRMANRIADAMDDVLFVVVGSDRTVYGSDPKPLTGKTFREHVIATERPDLRRFRFLGTVPRTTLVDVLSLSDLHVYLTVPFVLSWSLLDALACECVVLASDTAPVREVIEDGVTGWLAGFFDVEGLAKRALDVLADPGAHRHLAAAGRALVEERYSLDRTLPRLLTLLRDVSG